MFNFGVSMTFATYVAFLISKGLNLFEVNFVNVVFFTTMFFCEIPTGAFADTFGRKKSYVISCFVFSLGEIAYSRATSMEGFLVAEIIAGIGRTFANGAYHAWLVDTLKYHGFQGSTKPVFRKEQMIRQFVGIPGAIIGGYIGACDLAYPWVAGGTVGIVCACIALLVMREEYFKKRSRSILGSIRRMFRSARKGLAVSRNNPSLRFALLVTVAFMFCVQAPNMQWQPHFGKKLETQYLGFIWAGLSFGIFLGMHYSVRISSWFNGDRKALAGCSVGVGILIILAGLTGNVIGLSLVAFFLHEIPRGAFAPLKEAFVNDSIEDRERATIISCQSTLVHLACLVGLFVSGVFADQFSIKAAWVIAGSVAIIVPLAALRLSCGSDGEI